MAEPRRLKKGVRLGVIRGGTDDFRAIATLRFASDGGVHITPAQLPGVMWRYGLHPSGRRLLRSEYSETEHRPKLHYHSSGYVAATLDGHTIEQRSAQFPALSSLRKGQIFSVSAVRPWELPRVEKPRAGDMWTLQPRWPWAVGWTLSLLELPEFDGTRLHLMRNRGLIAGDRTRFVLDLREFGRSALLIGHVLIEEDFGFDTEASVTVGAYANGPGQTLAQDPFLLWSSSARNPMVAWEHREHDIDVADLDAALAGPVSNMTVGERLERRWGIRPRHPNQPIDPS